MRSRLGSLLASSMLIGLLFASACEYDIFINLASERETTPNPKFLIEYSAPRRAHGKLVSISVTRFRVPEDVRWRTTVANGRFVSDIYGFTYGVDPKRMKTEVGPLALEPGHEYEICVEAGVTDCSVFEVKANGLLARTR